MQHLNTQSVTASGAGATGTPTIASFNIPSGKNRALFIWVSFERDHCSPADGTGGLCTSGNTAGTGLGDNYPEPRVGTPPATTSNNQVTARVTGPGGTINRQNALVIGGTPSGDTRFIRISTSPTGSPAGTAFFSVDQGETGARCGVLVEVDRTERIFTNPANERTEAYVTGRFG